MARGQQERQIDRDYRVALAVSDLGEIAAIEARAFAAAAAAAGRPVDARDAAAVDKSLAAVAAEAEARATQVVSEAIATSGTQALNYFIAQKYVEAVTQFATSPNSKTILFPVEATQLIGTLGGIGALAEAALGKGVGTTPAALPPSRKPGPFEQA